MREINHNNLDKSKVQCASLKHDVTDPIEPEVSNETQESIVSDFSNPTAEVLGRSQVSKVDNFKSDVDFANAHPETIEKSDKLFEMALKSLQADGDPDAYEKACAISTSGDAKALLS